MPLSGKVMVSRVTTLLVTHLSAEQFGKQVLEFTLLSQKWSSGVRELAKRRTGP